MSLPAITSNPTPNPIEKGFLKVSNIHELYYETFGNPEGIPIVVLHGGPGAGCNASMARFFDLSTWYVVMFDQRGAMRSKPFACMEENTTQDTLRDIERLKEHLGISQWACFGGSCGSLLALAYGQAYPESCLGFVVRSIFLGRKEDYSHLLYKMGEFFPEAYEEFLRPFSREERLDLISSCYQKIIDPNPEIHLPIAKHYLKWVAHGITPVPNRAIIQSYLENDKLALSMERAFFHFAKHEFFLTENQILSNMDKISHLPAIIIHGQQDFICLQNQAELLHSNWLNSTQWIVENAGHAPIQPEFLLAITNGIELLAKQVTKNAGLVPRIQKKKARKNPGLF